MLIMVHLEAAENGRFRLPERGRSEKKKQALLIPITEEAKMKKLMMKMRAEKKKPQRVSNGATD